MNELDVRPIAQGELFDPELAEAVERYGLEGGVSVLVHRRYYAMLEREFLTGHFPDGADTSLGIIDLEPLK